MSDAIPPCPVCGGECVRLGLTGMVACIGDASHYRNTVEAHATLCAMVERGRLVADATKHLELARHSIEEAQGQRDQARRELEAARTYLAQSEWGKTGWCRECGVVREYGKHDADCAWLRAMGRSETEGVSE